ncbi:MAG: peptide/nickel transport system permease protein [Trebonia sp.]|jgi:peptide/nickel transport system permease protein|nr:peptide/nickel transport system permease protein [Trebonia sp.]MDX6416087.1 peptide/nickel transport system permease protein [Trebonia sp.]
MAVEDAAPLARSLRGIAVPRIASVIGGRLISAILVIWGVVTLTFLLTRVFSGDPTNLFAQPTDTAADRAAIRQRLGLADPIPVQYVHYLNDVIHGNLGTSYLTFRPVTADLLNKLPATAELAVYALIFGVVVGVAVGVLSAVFEGSLFDKATRIFTAAGLALPQFWVALMLILIFYVQLHVVPGPTGRLAIGMQPPPTVTGFYTIDSILTGHLSTFWPAVRQLILPVLTLGYVVASPLAGGTRSAMILALRADYVRTARALGLSRSRIWFVYAFRNAMLPVITMLAGLVAFVLSGTVLIEAVFGWPGVGQYALNALQQSDFPAVQGFVLYASILYVVIYQLLDIAYSFADPRIRS